MENIFLNFSPFLDYILHGDLVSQSSVMLYVKRTVATSPEIQIADSAFSGQLIKQKWQNAN